MLERLKISSVSRLHVILALCVCLFIYVAIFPVAKDFYHSFKSSLTDARLDKQAEQKETESIGHEQNANNLDPARQQTEGEINALQNTRREASDNTTRATRRSSELKRDYETAKKTRRPRPANSDLNERARRALADARDLDNSGTDPSPTPDQ